MDECANELVRLSQSLGTPPSWTKWAFKAARLLRATQINGRSPPSTAGKTAQEPTGWRADWYGDVSDLGNYVYTEDRDELDHEHIWTPLYAAPQQNEAVALLSEARHWLGAYADADPLYERILAYLEQHK